MPPSEKVSREDMIAAALRIVERDGLSALTARGVAQELSVSTAPVYRNFAAMQELSAAAMERARDLLLQYTERAYTELPFLSMGTGVAVFAREHPRLYHALFLETDAFRPLLDDLLERLTQDIRRDGRFAQLDHARRAQLLERMWTYTHGLASMIAVGLAKDTSTSAIVASLGVVGGAVIRTTLEQPIAVISARRLRSPRPRRR